MAEQIKIYEAEDSRSYHDIRTREMLWATNHVRLDLGNDATGDMFYRAADKELDRVPIGTINQRLTVGPNSIPIWQDNLLDNLTNVQINSVVNGQVLRYNNVNSRWENWTPNFLTSETDPVFNAHPAATITPTLIANWTTAYGWGDYKVRSVNTQHSLTGGGTLALDRTINLVNDVSAPGNHKVYGTNASGVRGWIDRYVTPTPNLQQVTDVGHTTTNSMIVAASASAIGGLAANQFKFEVAGGAVARGYTAGYGLLLYDSQTGSGPDLKHWMWTFDRQNLGAGFNENTLFLYPWNDDLTGPPGIGAAAAIEVQRNLRIKLGYLNDNSGTIRAVTSLNGVLGLGDFTPATRTINTLYSIIGGGTLAADRTFSLINDVAAPGANMHYGTDGLGVRGWFPSTADTNNYTTAIDFNTSTGVFTLSILGMSDLTESIDGRYALLSRTITSQHSITGGGDFTANRVFNLVNDVASPGIDKVYGTNSSGVRGWRDFPSGSGGGTVTSVGLALPTDVFDVTGSPVTTNGTLTGAFKNQLQRLFFASPNSATGVPTFRAIVGSDLPGYNNSNWDTAFSWGNYALRSLLTQYSITGGGTFAADRTINLVNDVAAPGNDKYYGTNGSGTRGWYSMPTTGGGDVLSTRAINTQYSIAGGGDLSIDRIHNLVNDVAAPGAKKFYGTDGSGVRGWQTVSDDILNQFASNQSASWRIAGQGMATSTAFASSGSYATMSTLDVPYNGSAFSAGSVHAGVFNMHKATIGGNTTVPNSVEFTGAFSILQFTATANGTLTMSQGVSSQLRAAAAHQVQVNMVPYVNTITSTITHVAGFNVLGIYQNPAAAGQTWNAITNYYAVLIGNQAEQLLDATRITNRYALMQDGAGDIVEFKTTSFRLSGALSGTAATLIARDSSTGALVSVSLGTNLAWNGNTLDAAGGGGGTWTMVKKTTIENRTTATIAADSALSFSMAANTKYTFRLFVFYDTNATADFKYRTAGPASPTLLRIRRDHILAGTPGTLVTTYDTAYSAADVALAGTGTNGWIYMEGTIHNGVTAGSFSFQWAQNTANATASSVLPGSYLEYMLI